MVDAVDRSRIDRRLNELAEIGSNESGGVTRLAYTTEENQAFDYLTRELPEELTVDVDSIGNLFATTDPEADQSIYLGSHLDSVFNAGRLDGSLGVVTALEAIETVLESDDDFSLPPTLTVFRAEESTRFGQHTIGSRGALGSLTVEDFATTDQNDVPLWQAMQQAGFRPRNLSKPSIPKERVAAFFEVHIEQGRVLDETDAKLGAVTSIRAPVRCQITITGEYDHSGATPMHLRNDAVAAAGEFITCIEAIGKRGAKDGDLVATVGDIEAVSGAINTVCGEVRFPLDIRSNDESHRDEIETRVRTCLEALAERRSVDISWELLDRSSPVTLNENIVSFLKECADDVTPTRRLPSGGGHDAMNFQQFGLPTGMLFTPSIDGISHNPDEETDPDSVGHAARPRTRALYIPLRNGLITGTLIWRVDAYKCMHEYDKLIISCAVTGAIHVPTMSPHLPITPEEIADETVAAANAGASIVHIHVHDPETGEPVTDLELFEQVADDITSRCDAIVQPTTGGAPTMAPEERVQVIPRLAPEMASCNAGSINFGLYPILEKFEEFEHEWERRYLESTRDLIFKNTFEDLMTILPIFDSHGTKPELECYDVGHLYNINHLINQGYLETPIHLQFVTGIHGGIAAEPENLVHLVTIAEKLFGNEFSFSVIGAGKNQFPLACQSLRMGGHVRVGLEDNLYLRAGELAKSNAELVEKMVDLNEELTNRPIATPQEVREFLDLKGSTRVDA